MTLAPNDPFRGIHQMRNDLDQIFPDSIYPLHLQQTRLPIMDLHETDNEIIVTCDIPGLESKEDVDIDIDYNALTVKGAIKQSQEFNENHVRHRERFFGSFLRTITLPCSVDESGAKAVYRNGVLEIRMPKRENHRKNRIDIDFH